MGTVVKEGNATVTRGQVIGSATQVKEVRVAASRRMATMLPGDARVDSWPIVESATHACVLMVVPQYRMAIG